MIFVAKTDQSWKPHCNMIFQKKANFVEKPSVEDMTKFVLPVQSVVFFTSNEGLRLAGSILSKHRGCDGSKQRKLQLSFFFLRTFCQIHSISICRSQANGVHSMSKLHISLRKLRKR